MIRRISSYALSLLSVVAWPFAMASASDLTYLAHEPPKRSGHPPLIVLLHGTGADENDMIGLWPQLPATFVVVSPRAPFSDPAGGYRWYRKTPRSTVIEVDVQASRKFIDDIVEAALKRFDADPKMVFLAGFSQGAVMVYRVALEEPTRFRGAAVLSGSLAQPDRSWVLDKTRWTHDSIFIGHGTADERISFRSAVAAHEELEKLGVPNEFHAYSGMRHEIGDAETRDLSTWLTHRLAIENGAP